MLLSKFLKSFLAVACLCSLSACSNDEPNGESSTIEQDDNLSVTIKADGSTSNGASFSQLDGKTFFLDHVKYEIVGTHLEIIGYDPFELPSIPKLYANVTIGNTVYMTRKISSSAFENAKISSITLPTSITEVTDYAFYDCKSLKQITFPKDLTLLGSCAFEGCSSLTHVTLPNALTLIESQVFDRCTSLAQVKFPDNLKEIESSAFWGCSSLKEITLPKNLKAIMPCAFYGCKSLKKVIFLSLTPPKTEPSSMFDSYPTAYVKSEALGTYRNWDFLNCFAEIKPIYY